MRKRSMPGPLYVRALGLIPSIPCTYDWQYLGRAIKRTGGHIDLGADDPKDNRKLRIVMSDIILRGRSGKKHTYHIGWLPVEFNHNTVYWGMGK